MRGVAGRLIALSAAGEGLDGRSTAVACMSSRALQPGALDMGLHRSSPAALQPVEVCCSPFESCHAWVLSRPCAVYRDINANAVLVCLHRKA